jgi:hypothetical protein
VSQVGSLDKWIGFLLINCTGLIHSKSRKMADLKKPGSHHIKTGSQDIGQQQEV